MDNKPVDIWTSCLDCGQRVTGDSIHTCSPQIKELSDEEIRVFMAEMPHLTERKDLLMFARAILKKASEK
jgi:succinate dehydrogenase/fumarate reductase-like Fe-S protein